MPNHDPMLGVAFVAAIFLVALFATLFPEKPKDSKPADVEELNKKFPTDGAGE